MSYNYLRLVIAATLYITVNSASLNIPIMYPSSSFGNSTANSSVSIDLEPTLSSNELDFIFALDIGTQNTTN